MAADPLDPDARPERAKAVRAMRNVAAGVVMLVAVGAAAWLALSGDPTRNRPIEISAAPTPERLPPDPDKPNGAQIPHRGQIVYEIVGREEAQKRAEGMAPAPETPMAAPTELIEPAPVDNTTAPSSSENAPGPVQLLPPAPPAIVIGDSDPAPLLPGPPARAEVATPLPDTPADTMAPKPPKPSAPPPGDRPAQTIADLVARADAASPKQPPALAPNAPKAPAALPPPVQRTAKPPPLQPPTTTATPPGPFRIQLGAVRDKAAAQREWRRLRRKHPNVLGKLQLFVQQVNISGKGVFHRIQAGPMAERVLAEVACDQLIAEKAPCFVIAK